MASRNVSFIIGLLAYGGALLVGAGGAYLGFESLFLTAAQPQAEPKAFIVDPGMGVRKVAEKLEKEELLDNWWSFYALHRLKAESGKGEENPTIHPGEYMVSAAMKPGELLDIFLKGEVVYRKFTVPEGYSIYDLPEVMAGTGLVTEAEARAALQNLKIIARFRIPAKTPEGYLFPSTYQFTRPDNAEKMVLTMLERGKQQFNNNEWKQRALELGLSFHQILTLASIIEKETGAPEERKTISSVFHNRLRIAMPLQTDPTIIYGILDRDGSFNGNLTKKDLTTPGSYNTYLNQGLPPTPICNPGKAAIEAALYPADTDYLYFVSKGDGTHVFSSTYKEHLRAVNQYQRGKKINVPALPKKKRRVEEPPPPPPEKKKEVFKKKKKTKESNIFIRRGNKKVKKQGLSQLEFE